MEAIFVSFIVHLALHHWAQGMTLWFETCDN